MTVNIYINNLTSENIEVLKEHIPKTDTFYCNHKLPSKITNVKYKDKNLLENPIVFIDAKENFKKEFPFLKTLNPVKLYIAGVLVWKEKPLRKITTPNGATLREYQVKAVEFALKSKRCGLFIDMGLGKTLSSLAAINELLETKQLNSRKPILIIAPKTVALDTWSREAEKWGYDYDVIINIGLTPKKRDKLFEKTTNFEKPTLITTNPAQLANIIKYFGEDAFEMIVIDELTQFKNPKATCTILMQKLTRNAKYVFGLTGTPTPNSMLELYGQVAVIDEYKTKTRLGVDQFKYRDNYFTPDIVNNVTGQIYSYKLQKNALDKIISNVRDFTISMKTADLLELPEITTTNLFVKMNKKAKETYDYLAKEISEQIRIAEKEVIDGISDSKSTSSLNIVADLEHNTRIANRGVLKSKLLQLASGAIYKQDGSFDVYHDEKFVMLKDIVENATSPLLVFYNFKSDLIRAREYIKFEHLESKNKNASEIMRKWNNGEIPVLFLNPTANARGLNIQDGGHTIIWLTLTHNNEIYRQANKRLHRSGQKNNVQVIHILTEGTEEIKIIEKLTNREIEQDNLMTKLK